MTERPGVLFDVDGTLLDTNYLHVVAWCRAFRRCGHPDASMASIHRAIGIDSKGLVQRLLGSADDEVIEAHTAAYSELRDEVKAFLGAADLVRRCRDAGLMVVLATSGKQEDLEWMLPAIDAGDALAGAVTSADVDQGKPAPDLLTAGIDKFGLDRQRTVAVGDTVWDVEAAKKAGVPCVALESGGIAREALEKAGAHQVYDDPAALLDHFDDSPLGRLNG